MSDLSTAASKAGALAMRREAYKRADCGPVTWEESSDDDGTDDSADDSVDDGEADTSDGDSADGTPEPDPIQTVYVTGQITAFGNDRGLITAAISYQDNGMSRGLTGKTEKDNDSKKNGGRTHRGSP
jgi:hypothetical protein